ncbi:unnamed protein product [Macrosiphum euphorbiae]|uniref:Uncharacterized protein n=1 Tax=Macrosiphum euphorbiae TaxID=13131 RepID=A0AAV0WSI8_9HEMI|nr:unnamed protein product [Macrosiphum euphorbiae]
MTAQTDQQHGFSGAPGFTTDQVLSRAHMVVLNTSTPLVSSVRVLAITYPLLIAQARTSTVVKIQHRSQLSN